MEILRVNLNLISDIIRPSTSQCCAIGGMVITFPLQEFADQLQIPFLETSAKNATNVEQAFMTMASEIKRAQGPDNDHVSGPGTTVRITPSSQPVRQKEGKGCC